VQEAGPDEKKKLAKHYLPFVRGVRKGKKESEERRNLGQEYVRESAKTPDRNTMTNLRRESREKGKKYEIFPRNRKTPGRGEETRQF